MFFCKSYYQISQDFVELSSKVNVDVFMDHLEFYVICGVG